MRDSSEDAGAVFREVYNTALTMLRFVRHPDAERLARFAAWRACGKGSQNYIMAQMHLSRPTVKALGIQLDAVYLDYQSEYATDDAMDEHLGR